MDDIQRRREEGAETAGGRVTRTDIISLLRTRQGPRTQRQFADELGVSESYLSSILVGRNEPGPAVLKALGLKRVISYEEDNHDHI